MLSLEQELNSQKKYIIFRKFDLKLENKTKKFSILLNTYTIKLYSSMPPAGFWVFSLPLVALHVSLLSSLSCPGVCEGHCHNAGTCLQTGDGTKLCLCTSQYIGHQCELDKCQFCGTGKCLTSPSGEVTCRWVPWLQNLLTLCVGQETKNSTQRNCHQNGISIIETTLFCPLRARV